ncbi:MAG TPA: hypothetical protein VEI97_09280 [bacterium]|nr:hypothetical protein [bacterium]
MHRLVAAAFAFALLMLTPAIGAERDRDDAPKYKDPIRYGHSDSTLDAAYLWEGLNRLADRLDEVDGDDGDRTVREMIGFLTGLGFSHLDTYRQFTTIDEDGFYELLSLKFRPEVEDTPIGRWLNTEPTESAIPGRIRPEEFLVFLTVSNPEAYLELADEVRMDEIREQVSEEVPEAAGVGRGVEHVMGMAEALLVGSRDLHLAVYDVQVDQLKPSAALIIEYRDGAQAFRDTLVPLSDDGDGGDLEVFRVNGPGHIPVEPAWAVQGNLAVMATDPETVRSTFAWATDQSRKGQSRHEDTIYETRINAERVRALVPGWLLDMAAAEAGGPGGAPDIDFASLRGIPLGVIDVRRMADPNTLAIEMTADRGLVHFGYKLYEQVIVSALVDEARKARQRRIQQRAEENGYALQAALDSYFAEHGVYPHTLQDLAQTPHLGTWPENPFSGGRVLEVDFESRAPGEITYVQYSAADDKPAYQLLVYGPSEEYFDQINNTERNENGSFIEGPDGYEDMVSLFLSSETTGVDDEGLGAAWDEPLPEPVEEGMEPMESSDAPSDPEEPAVHDEPETPAPF